MSGLLVRTDRDNLSVTFDPSAFITDWEAAKRSIRWTLPLVRHGRHSRERCRFDPRVAVEGVAQRDGLMTRSTGFIRGKVGT